MTRILVGTADGVHEFGADGSPTRVHHAGRSVTAVAPEGPKLWAILDGREVWRAEGDDWSRVGILEDLRANCIADTRAGYIVGTSEAHLYRVGGNGLEPVESFDEIDGRAKWYTPWGGPPDSRSISEDDSAVYVNIHVGGIARSRDEGATWVPTIDIDADVHKVWASTGRVFAACAVGLAVSEDQGDSWTIRTEGLHSTYCRAVALCGDTVLVSASDGPRGGRRAVYRGSPATGPFERCREGLPEWFDQNIDSYCLDAIPDLAVFGTGDGRVFVSTDEGRSWSELASGLRSVQ